MADTNRKYRLKTSVGGQAVIEGVMMRTPHAHSVAGGADGSIEVKTGPRGACRKAEASRG